ncbi:endonuclease domain-containing protein [uncultured Brevundimonas sp.]|uniref:endonuclease domain-containing protein n=1 Tax=uncultured Brevundimonas sp. TaxID=213418 RepID=UPI0026108FA3|nr:endonuclease domain-containing protein [uncultured Brevundimonas sp.]
MDAPDLTIARARELRRRMSLPEVLLWKAVRRDKLGARFRRQHPEGPWILDFYCHAARLAVEIDGAGHDDPDRMLLDRKRTRWLEQRGISVHRIPARAVLGNLDGVLTGLKERIGRGPLHHPSEE